MLYHFIILMNLYILSHQSQILEKFETCKLVLESGVTKKGKPKFNQFTVPKLIQVEDNELKVWVSLCGDVPTISPNNGSCSNSCIYVKESKSLITSNTSPIVPFEQELWFAGEFSLLLRNELRCTDDQNYEVRVKMVSIPSFTKPRLIVENLCMLSVEILNPQYTPPCTYLFNSQSLIDLRPLLGKTLKIPIEGGDLHISLCGPNRNCGNSIAACLKSEKGDSLVIGETKTQQVRFDDSKNQLKVIASFKEGQGRPRNMEVLVRCNWKVPYLSNAKYLKPSIQGRNYKFVVESSFACIKVATDCLINDKENNLIYDLRGLYKKEGYKISMGSKDIKLNICGKLEVQGSRGNECSSQYSQVCEVKGNVFHNLGSITHFDTREEFITATFRDGFRCNENQTYSTQIEIRCSRTEKSPVFVRNESCTTFLAWETPKACPKFEKRSDTCHLSTTLGQVNLSDMFDSTDRLHSFSPSEKFMFNICGNLHSNCSTYNNVTACYVKGNQEMIIGWNEPSLTYSNGKLQLKYSGEKCNSGKGTSSLTIDLFCSYAERPKATQLRKVDQCTFAASVYSVSACLSKEFRDCTFKGDYLEYNLNALIGREGNYQIEDDEDENVTYFLNVCKPVIAKDGVLVSGGSAVIMRNKNEPYVMNRYTSLGAVAGPTVENGKLLIHSILGWECKPGVSYESKIFFECSDDNGLPKLLKKNGCSYEFSWKTKYACPKIQPGGKCSMKIGNTNINLPSHEFHVNDGQNASYTFSMCLDEYEWCRQGSCSKNILVRKPRFEEEKINLELNLNNSKTCVDGSPLKLVNLTVECDSTKNFQHSIKSDKKNCQVDVQVLSKMACKNVLATEDPSGGHDMRIIKLSGDEKEFEVNTSSNGPSFLDKMKDIIGSIKNHADTKEISNTEEKVDKNAYKSKAFRSENGQKGKEQVGDNEVYEVAKTNETKNKQQHRNEDVKKKKPKDVETLKTKINEQQDQVEDLPQIKKVQINDNKAFKGETQNDSINNEVQADQSSRTETAYQKCNIARSTTEFNLKDIKSLEIRGIHNYVINFDGSSRNCGGNICRNGVEVLHFIEKCPVISYDEAFVKLSYSVTGRCHHKGNLSESPIDSNFDVDIFLKCDEKSPHTSLLKEAECGVDFEYYSPKICHLLNSTKSSAILEISIGSVVLLVAICILSYVMYQKKYCKRRSYKSVRDSESNLVHFKLT